MTVNSIVDVYFNGVASRCHSGIDWSVLLTPFGFGIIDPSGVTFTSRRARINSAGNTRIHDVLNADR